MARLRTPPPKKPGFSAKLPSSQSKGKSLPSELQTLQHFFQKGAEFTEELVHENERLRRDLLTFRTENATLKSHLKSNRALQDLLKKIDLLEKEKNTLVSHLEEVEASSNRYTDRQSEMEQELNNLANLYIASFQLHSTLKVKRVTQHLRELLAQLIGAASHAYYFVDPKRKQLLPLVQDGLRTPLKPLTLGGDHSSATDRAIERAFLTDAASFRKGPDGKKSSDPVACIPLRIEDKTVGVLAVFTMLPQKRHLLPVDYEFFKMLGAHAATALVGALLYSKEHERLPPLEPLLTLTL